jgi:hypothetical protein
LFQIQLKYYNFFNFISPAFSDPFISALEAKNVDPSWYEQNAKDTLTAASYAGLDGLLKETARLNQASARSF